MFVNISLVLLRDRIFIKISIVDAEKLYVPLLQFVFFLQPKSLVLPHPTYC